MSQYDEDLGQWEDEAERQRGLDEVVRGTPSSPSPPASFAVARRTLRRGTWLNPPETAFFGYGIPENLVLWREYCALTSGEK